MGSVTVEDYLRQIEKEIHKHDLKDKVILIEGFKPDDRCLADAYMAADVFVLPSRHEPFGIVILEAWAAGVPVVAANVGESQVLLMMKMISFCSRIMMKKNYVQR